MRFWLACLALVTYVGISVVLVSINPWAWAGALIVGFLIGGSIISWTGPKPRVPFSSLFRRLRNVRGTSHKPLWIPTERYGEAIGFLAREGIHAAAVPPLPLAVADPNQTHKSDPSVRRKAEQELKDKGSAYIPPGVKL